MATKACTVSGFKYYNGGWIPSSGYSSASNSNTGYGGGNYVAVYKFTIPSASGALARRSLTIKLPWIDGGYASSFGVTYTITTSGPADGLTSPTSIQGTKILSGTTNGSGTNSAQWAYVTFTTGTTSSFPTGGGTYYLWLTSRSGYYAAEFGGGATITLNYSEQTTPTTATVSLQSVANATVSGAGTYTVGNTVTISCTPASGYKFVRWDISGIDIPEVALTALFSFKMPSSNVIATAVVEKDDGYRKDCVFAYIGGSWKPCIVHTNTNGWEQAMTHSK